jgi:ribonucleoside-triphosphate reductase
MFQEIIKRDGHRESFDRTKIKNAIWKAAQAVNGTDEGLSDRLTDEVSVWPSKGTPRLRLTSREFRTSLKKCDRSGACKDREGLYSLSRKAPQHARDQRPHRRDDRYFGDYLNDRDWGVKENANMQRSVNGLNNYVARRSPRILAL